MCFAVSPILQEEQQIRDSAAAAAHAAAAAAAASAEANRVVAVYSRSGRRDVAVTVTNKMSLRQGEWIDDVIMEVGSHLIIDQDLKEESNKDVCYVISSFFSAFLCEVL